MVHRSPRVLYPYLILNSEQFVNSMGNRPSSSVRRRGEYSWLVLFFGGGEILQSSNRLVG
jgi:hypothetical protein